MNWLDRLEKKYRKYAIHNLAQYIVGGMAIVFIFSYINSQILETLSFSLAKVLEGQIWRIFTFIFLPRTTSMLWIIFSLLFFLFAGRVIEQNWGVFKFNLYYLTGIIGTIVAGVFLEAVFGGSVPLTNYYLNMSIFLALAATIPDYEIRIYFILPVKMKYMGYLFGALIVWDLLTAAVYMKVVILVSMINFIVFFGPLLMKKSRQKYSKQQYKQANQQRPTRRPSNPKKNGEVIQVAFHYCEVCKRTEVDDPSLEFRYCSKCTGRHEYCTEHIMSHEHKTEE
jgi:membrane associated rhomboid family serine protease